MGTFYVTPNGITTSGWLRHLKDIQEAAGTAEYSRAIDALAGVSSPLPADWYSVRLLFRFTPENGLDLLRPRIIETALQSILADKAPQQVTSFKTTMGYRRNPFSDTLELEVSSDEIQFRYLRGALAFDSYEKFFQAANVNNLVNDLAPFLELLWNEESK
jgi:hypothetical protein